MHKNIMNYIQDINFLQLTLSLLTEIKNLFCATFGLFISLS